MREENTIKYKQKMTNRIFKMLIMRNEARDDLSFITDAESDAERGYKSLRKQMLYDFVMSREVFFIQDGEECLVIKSCAHCVYQ